MATGLGHMFGVQLPQNFNSPYQATDPSDFWRRWHITLSTWLRDYLYFPLGGNRTGHRTRNLIVTMLLGGLWHGAAGLFVIWGLWHGLLLAGFHVLKEQRFVPSNDGPIGYWFNRQLTFCLIIIGWVFFRSADVRVGAYGAISISPAFKMFGQMAGIYGLRSPLDAMSVSVHTWMFMALCWVWCNFAPNSFDIAYNLPMRKRYAVLAGCIMVLCLAECNTPIDFLYFRF
jgi:hypothetical protein